MFFIFFNYANGANLRNRSHNKNYTSTFNYNCYGNDTVYRGIFNNFQNEVNFTRKEIASNNQIIKMLLQNNNYLEKQFS